MATIQRVGQIQAQRVEEQREVEQLQRRLNLFTSSTFERARSLAFQDGTRVDVPTMTEEDRNTAGRIFAAVPAEKQAAVQASFDALAAAIYAESKSGTPGVQVGSTSSGLVNQLNQTTELFVVTTGKAQADQAVQGVMFGAMIGIEQDLGNFAQDVQDRLNLAGTVRTDITELRNEIADWDPPDAKKTFTYTEVTFDEAGNMHVETKTVTVNKKEAEELLEKLEMQLNTLSDMNEMMKFDLQQKTHDYQQALGTLSGLLKASHESLMAIIRNVKAS